MAIGKGDLAVLFGQSLEAAVVRGHTSRQSADFMSHQASPMLEYIETGELASITSSYVPVSQYARSLASNPLSKGGWHVLISFLYVFVQELGECMSGEQRQRLANLEISQIMT